jgi:hypothetical protein
MSNESITICEGCRREMDPHAPDTVKAVELVPTPTFGDPHGMVEGLGVLFHESCWVGSPRYKRLAE